jgi:hypothetical protein
MEEFISNKLSHFEQCVSRLQPYSLRVVTCFGGQGEPHTHALIEKELEASQSFENLTRPLVTSNSAPSEIRPILIPNIRGMGGL